MFLHLPLLLHAQLFWMFSSGGPHPSNLKLLGKRSAKQLIFSSSASPKTKPPPPTGKVPPAQAQGTFPSSCRVPPSSFFHGGRHCHPKHQPAMGWSQTEQVAYPTAGGSSWRGRCVAKALPRHLHEEFLHTALAQTTTPSLLSKFKASLRCILTSVQQ